MKKIFLILMVVLTCSISYGKGIERVSATYEYISDNPNETPEEAERMAFEKAREKALENQFGIDVNRINTTYISNKTGENNDVLEMFSLGGSSVRGEWIETIEETVIEKRFEQGFWIVKVRVEGKARSVETEPIDIAYYFVNDIDDRSNRDVFYDEDDIFLKFSSPVNGSLCVYLIDTEENAYCLLPYSAETTGCQQVEANREYVFFSQDYDHSADEYVLGTEKSVEYNAFYIVFSPNKFTKARDFGGKKNWKNQPLPRVLPYADFLKWLSRNQIKDKKMVVKTSVIAIRK